MLITPDKVKYFQPKSEAQLQAAFVQYVWNYFEQTRKHIWAVPNDAIGRWKSLEDVLRSEELKATGLLSGVWDLHMFWWGSYHIIETKLPGQQLTTDRPIFKNGKLVGKRYGQKEWGDLMASHGAHRHIYHTLTEGVEMMATILRSGPDHPQASPPNYF